MVRGGGPDLDIDTIVFIILDHMVGSVADFSDVSRQNRVYLRQRPRGCWTISGADFETPGAHRNGAVPPNGIFNSSRVIQ